MKLLRWTLLASSLAISAACASKGSTAGADNAPRRDRSVITQEEIVASKASDAYAVIRALRPAWLLPKIVGAGRQNVQVYVEGTRAGNTSILQQYQSGQIRELRLFEADEATTRFGPGNGAGAILVSLRR